MVKAYCVKCKKMSDVKDSKTVTSKNGRKRLAGVCKKCGTKVSKFI